MKQATAMMVLLAATPLAFGQAEATIELPTVGVQSVQTTVAVPSGGGAVIGGVGTGAGRRVALPGGIALDRVARGGNIMTDAQIIDLRSMAEERDFVHAAGLYKSGRIAEAIDIYRELAESSVDPARQRHARDILAAVKTLAMTKARKALEQAKSDDPGAALRAIEEVLEQYRLVISDPAIHAAHRQLAEHPANAEPKHGAAAMNHYVKGESAEMKGKHELARVYYRLAARKKGTTASLHASEALARLDRIETHVDKSAEFAKKKTPPIAPRPLEGPDPQRLISTARLQRQANPTKARELYRQALLALPVDSPLFVPTMEEARRHVEEQEARKVEGR
ncbi:hypothetical protein Pan216_22120 [Planctomycetes bacterium Pan216]|uniref:Tetratricopeptide repeat protein n=1 Tax=Kolteria novifilia TaxID=2527975 RepID=A0A518B350_9BACT|nr:hypothetical protein Pan216_22120 [Planctomycetes bacterium Pan216]